MEMCREPGVRQVLPCGVFLFDQPHLACANPALELLLTGDGVANIAELFEVILHRTVVSPLLSSKASATCHPERRRREGSACSQRRRLGAATVEEGPLFSRAQPRMSSTRSATPGTRTGVSVSPRLAVRTSA